MIKEYLQKINILLQKHGDNKIVLYNIIKSNNKFIDILSKKTHKGGAQLLDQQRENIQDSIAIIHRAIEFIKNIDTTGITEEMYKQLISQLNKILEPLNNY
jgi:hypothetical protein